MADITVEGLVPQAPEEAFDIYVNQIDTWWPRKGVFPYSFAPASTRPLHIQFEPRPAGRFFETFADGRAYTIGLILAWEPPNRLVYSWRDPEWPGEIQITATFSPLAEGTRIEAAYNGFKAAGVADLIPFYAIGNRQTLAGYLAHCRALHELRRLQAGN